MTNRKPQTKEEWAAYQRAADARWAERQAKGDYFGALDRCHADPCINTYSSLKAAAEAR